MLPAMDGHARRCCWPKGSVDMFGSTDNSNAIPPNRKVPQRGREVVSGLPRKNMCQHAVWPAVGVLMLKSKGCTSADAGANSPETPGRQPLVFVRQ